MHKTIFCLAGAILLGLPSLAGAAPVFSDASVSLDAISPNGDGIQEFTIVRYTIDTDSALVRVNLNTPGGILVDVLQPFTRQGRGSHSVVFDGNIASGSAVDGDYEVAIIGVDTGPLGSEQVDIPLLIDRIAPVVTTWDIVSPADSVLQDGVTVTLHACVTGDPDTVTLDLSALDSNYDPGLVTVNLAPPECRLFTYTLSAGNTVPDTLGPVAVVAGYDRAGNPFSATLDLCLSNDPPTILSATRVNASEFFQNGDEVQVEIEVDSPNTITPTGDFLNFDSGFDPGQIQFEDLGSQRFLVRYRISDTNIRTDGEYALNLIARDNGCGEAVDTTLSITLDNAGVFSSLVDQVSLNASAFSPHGNGRDRVQIHFTVLEDSLTVSLTATQAQLVDSETLQDVTFLLPTTYDKGNYIYVWDGNSPSVPDTAFEDQRLEIVLRAVSLSRGQQRTVRIPLEMDSTPPILSGFPSPESTILHNGQRVDLSVTFDRPGYDLDVLFTNVDSEFNPLVSKPAIVEDGSGIYQILYTLNAANTFPDSADIPLIVTAVDSAENVMTSDLIRVCLNNIPPVHVSSNFVGSEGPFTAGNRVVLQTKWSTEPAALPLVVTADFSAVDDKFGTGANSPTVVDMDNGLFEIAYTLSQTNGIKAGNGPILITARDDPLIGCGETTVQELRLELDSVAGPVPTLSTTTPVTGISTALISGTAPEAFDVVIERNEEPADTFLVNQNDDSFLGTVSLEPGNNSFTARSRDLAGNRSFPSPPVDIFFAQTTTLLVPGRFGPGDEFFLALLEPSGRVRVRIFNLEGIELRRLEEPGGSIVRVAWNGEDNTGTMTTSGPCLAVVEIEDSQGVIRERVRRAFIFTRRRAGS